MQYTELMHHLRKLLFYRFLEFLEDKSFIEPKLIIPDVGKGRPDAVEFYPFSLVEQKQTTLVVSAGENIWLKFETDWPPGYTFILSLKISELERTVRD